MTRGDSGPPRPTATITGLNPSAMAWRATALATAVLPVRLPVAKTRMDGLVKIFSKVGGRSSKSAPR
jgi:hypothetical protein